MIIDKLSAFNRIDFLINNYLSQFNSRILNVAVPLLSLNSKTATFCSTTINLYQGYRVSAQLVNDISQKKWKKAGADVFHLSVVVTSLALPVLMNQAQLLFSSAIFFITEVRSLSGHIYNRAWRDALVSNIKIAHQLIHVGAMVYRIHALLAFSLLSQAIAELRQALEFGKKDQKPEVVVHILMALFRLYAAQSHVDSTARNLFGKDLTQKDWETFLEEQGNRSFSDFLQKEWYKDHINQIDFTGQTLEDFAFQDITFSRCRFSSTKFLNSKWINVSAKDCHFQNSTWINSFVQNSVFNRCNLSSSSFTYSEIKNTTWEICNLDLSCFNNSLLMKISFLQSHLTETSFLNAFVTNGKLLDCDLTNTLLLDTKIQ